MPFKRASFDNQDAYFNQDDADVISETGDDNFNEEMDRNQLRSVEEDYDLLDDRLLDDEEIP